MIFLLSPKDITDYTIVDTEYWRETENRLLIKTAYEYNNKADIEEFPKTLGDWNSFDFKYPENVYESLNADILLSRAYTKNGSFPVWIDFISSKTGESFHKPNICVKGSGWNIDSESIAEFKIANPPNPFTKLYTNRLDTSKDGKRQIMIYWFMFKKFGSKDAITMIRIISPVRNNDIDVTFKSVKDFLENQLFGAMYKSTEKEKINTAEYIVEQYGNKGLFVMAMMLLIPIGVTFIGIRKRE